MDATKKAIFLSSELGRKNAIFFRFSTKDLQILEKKTLTISIFFIFFGYSLYRLIWPINMKYVSNFINLSVFEPKLMFVGQKFHV